MEPSVHPAIDAMCRRALAANVSARYPSASEFRADLDAHLEKEGLLGRKRELPILLNRIFAQERRRLRRKIELMLSEPMSIPAAGSILALPRLEDDDPEDGFTVLLASFVEGDDDDDVDEGATKLMPSTGMDDPDAEDETRVDPLLLATASGMATPPPTAPQPTMLPVVKQPAEGAALTSNRRFSHLLWAGGPLAISLLALAVLFQIRGRSTGRPSPKEGEKTVVSAQPVAPIGSAPDGGDTVTLFLSASPASAEFTVDETHLRGNPYRGRMLQDAQEHVIRVSAPGYVTRDAIVPFTKDIVIDVALEPTKPVLAAERVAKPAIAAPVRRAPVRPSPSSAGSSPRPARLDRTDPW
jgi:hypothetical protein